MEEAWLGTHWSRGRNKNQTYFYTSNMIPIPPPSMTSTDPRTNTSLRLLPARVSPLILLVAISDPSAKQSYHPQGLFGSTLQPSMGYLSSFSGSKYSWEPCCALSTVLGLKNGEQRKTQSLHSWDWPSGDKGGVLPLDKCMYKIVLYQWFSTFLILRLFNIVPHVVVIRNMKLFS